MASSKPVVRTYVRKRKETAEEKYDAIFGVKPKNETSSLASPSKGSVNEIKRRRVTSNVEPDIKFTKNKSVLGKSKESAEEKYDAIFGVKPKNETSSLASPSKGSVNEIKRRRVTSNVEPDIKFTKNKSALGKSKESAEEKFDAIFGRRNGSSKKSPTKHTSSYNFSTSDDEDAVAEMTRTHSNLSSEENDPSSDDNKKEQSKYEKLFEENEKLASDKFDALFSESEYIAKPKQIKLRGKNKTKDQSQVLDNLYSFNSWEDESASDASKYSSSSPQKSPTKLPSITHASMVKVGGRLVLNIQRGGNTNSLSDKRGIMLVSPGEKTVKPDFVSSAKHDESMQTKKSEPVAASSNDHVKSQELLQRKGFEVHKKMQSQPAFKGLFSKDDVELPKPVRISSSPTKKILGSSGKKLSKPNVSYNPRPWASNAKELQSSSQESYLSDSLSQPSQSSLGSTGFSLNSKSKDVPALKKSVTWPKNVGESIVTSLKCEKQHQQYFTVVRHVKNYQNCLEEGEIQEFEDEVLYLQEGLPSDQPLSVRCLSVTSLACKCEQQNFRLYLRAHNVLTKVFDALQDADENKALSLATSSLLYMLSRDRQIDINKATLRILLKLVDPLEKNKSEDASHKTSDKVTAPKSKYSRLYKRKQESSVTNSDHEIEVVRSKIKELIDRCGDPLVTSQDLSTKVLASEALLRYTARRTSEWFREEIRLKGGLDHVISLVKAQVDIIENLPANLDCSCQPLRIERPLCTLERLLRVLENGIINSARNAMYLVTHQRALLLKKISLLMTRSKKWLAQTEDIREPDAPPSSAKNTASLLIKNVIAQIIKLLVNISNDSEWSSTRIGDQEGMLHNILSCILHIPEHVDEDHRYEIMLLSLGLMVNLVESSAKNRMALMQMKTHSSDQDDEEIPIVDALVQLFIDREIAARDNEILGEDGVKRAAEARRMQKASGAGNLNKSSQHAVALGDADDEGYWVESEEGMEWVPVQSKRDNDDDLPSSQGSIRSITDPNNIEAKLTAEEKDEMKQALDKANDHMEASIIASYTALVLGCLIHGSRTNATAIRSKLPNNGELSPMIKMLKKFLSFMNLTHGMSKKGEQKLIQVIEDMEDVNIDKLS